MKPKTKKKGFTLVELLIVMTIIAMLSLLAINGYMEYRKSTLLDFAADSIVAQINEMRSKAIHGDSGSARADVIREELGSADSEAPSGSDFDNPSDNATSPSGTALCYGVYFPDGAIKTFSSKFTGKKRFDVVSGQWKYEGCEDAADLNYAVIAIDEQVQIFNISDDNDVPFSNGFLRFVPPDGAIEVNYDGIGPLDPNPLSIKIEIQYGFSDLSKYKRIIEYDLNNFTANVKEPA